MLDHRPQLDGRPEHDRNARGDRDRGVEILRLELHQAADLLLRLGEGAIGDDRIAVADADGLLRRGAVELEAGAERAGLAEFAEQRLPLRHLFCAERRGLLG